MLKDPAAKLPYTVDWGPWLNAEADTVSAIDWTVPTGLVQETAPAPSVTSGKATVWISGGTVGETYPVVCRITTTGGRVDERTIRIRVEQR